MDGKRETLRKIIVINIGKNSEGYEVVESHNRLYPVEN